VKHALMQDWSRVNGTIQRGLSRHTQNVLNVAPKGQPVARFMLITGQELPITPLSNP